MLQRFIITIRAVGPFLIGMAACRQRTAAEEAQTATAVPVTLAPVTRDSLADEAVVTGRLVPVPGHDAVLTAPAAGIVRALGVQLGATVRGGQLVVALDVPELTATARQQAVAAAQSLREAERQQQLFADGLTSRRQLEEAEAAAHAAEAAATASRQLLAQTEVKSPIRGQVQQITVQPGIRVEAGARLAEVIGSDPLDLIAAAPVVQLARMRPGQRAWVTSDGDIATYPGRVNTLTPAVDSLTNAGQVLIRIPNPTGRLRAGAGATARVVLGVRHNVLVVPDSALVVAGDSAAVFVVAADSIARQRIVAVGVRQAGRAEVRGALRPGDAVVTTGAAGLQDGMHVVPTNRPAMSSSGAAPR